MVFVGMDNHFAAEGSARVINQDTMSEFSPDELDSDGDCSGGSSDVPGTPSITSRLSLLKLGSVISKFSDFKKQLVREIGFDGLLRIKSWQKINLKYSAYLMDRVDVDSSVINLEGQGMLELTDKSVHSIFAIPRGELAIGPECVEPSEACIEYTRFAASISDKGTHSLKAAEAYLLRDITAQSRQIDIQCFKIAFVIFVVGHVLAPSAKHDYITIDFWAALNDVSKIRKWNWCSYLLKHLFHAVRKFKSDVSKRNPTIHIVGCHLFLQPRPWSNEQATWNVSKDSTFRV
uniref:Aminotransferase-like plant mobile domain-containing protein n=1 Tax=Triticum urartu TaxID=4572 RepID=A0A8R7U982_TRIUA